MTRWIVMFNSERNGKQVRCLIDTALNKAEATKRHIEAWSEDDIQAVEAQLQKTIEAKQSRSQK